MRPRGVDGVRKADGLRTVVRRSHIGRSGPTEPPEGECRRDEHEGSLNGNWCPGVWLPIDAPWDHHKSDEHGQQEGACFGCWYHARIVHRAGNRVFHTL
jgi:hypothetical protein